MAKKLKIWNGRGWGGYRYDKDGNKMYDPTGIKHCDHAYVCAHSQAEAVRIINEARGGWGMTVSELRNYWSDCWGNSMEGIEPELGVWTTQKYNDKPKRIYPIEEEEK